VGRFRSLSPIGDRSKSFSTSPSSPEGEQAQNNSKQLEATAPAAEGTASDKINTQRQQVTELSVVVDSQKTDKSSERYSGYKLDCDEGETASSHRKFLQQYTTTSSSHSKSSMERPGCLNIVSDSIVAPKPFTGKADEDAEAWLDYLRRYVEHRHLPDGDFLTLFKLMMREAAADWLATVNRYEDRYDTPERELKRLVKLFENNYYRLAEWKETGDLWGKPQKATESVQDYMNRVRRTAKRLGLGTDVLYDAVLNGLRPALRVLILAQKPEGLEALAARVAEGASPPADDALSSTVVELMKASMKAQEMQAAEMSALTNKIAALATAQGHKQGLAIGMVEGRGDSGPPRQSRPPARQYRQTAQMRQRDNYVQNFASRQDGGGPRSFTRPASQQLYAQQQYTP